MISVVWSMTAAINITQATGLEDGSVVVTTYNQQEYSQFCMKVKGIKKLHHLCFESSSPGFIFVKERAGATEVKRSILKDKNWNPQADQVIPCPPILRTLSTVAVVSVREDQGIGFGFCPDHLKDTTCPRPSGPSVDLPFAISNAFPLTYSPSIPVSHHHHHSPIYTRVKIRIKLTRLLVNMLIHS